MPYPRQIQEVQGQLATLRMHRGERRFSVKDLVYLTVATRGEDSRHPEYPAWAMVQRFVAMASYRELWKLVAQFSQPINPIWAYPNNRRLALRYGGAAGRWTHANNIYQREHAGGATPPTSAHTAEHRIRHRRSNLNKIDRIMNGDEGTWNSFPRNVRDCTISILTGKTRSPIPTFTNFASNPADRNRLAQARRSGGVITWRGQPTRVEQFGSGNIFYEAPRIRNRLQNRQLYEIIGVDGISNRVFPVHFFPGGGGARTPRRSTDHQGETPVTPIPGTQETRPGMSGSEEDYSSSSGADDSYSGPVAVTQTIEGAGNLTVDTYNMMSPEEVDQLLGEWADRIEEILTSHSP